MNVPITRTAPCIRAGSDARGQLRHTRQVVIFHPVNPVMRFNRASPDGRMTMINPGALRRPALVLNRAAIGDL
jgi:hypothetical protein